MAPLLALHEVSLTFRRGPHPLQALANVTLQIGTGELLAVLAQRAQGKSTLLRVAAGVQRPDAGQVRFDGHDVWRQPRRARGKPLAAEICLLDHDRPDLDLTVRELVALPLLAHGPRREAYAKADHALSRAGLPERAAHRWDDLANSERALLMLARGIARRPRLLVIDDLVVGLGLSSGKQICSLLRTLAEEDGFAVLMSATDAHATICCDRVGSLVAGRLQLALEAVDPDSTIPDFPEAPRQAVP